MGLWMVERFTLAGVTFQNWMIVALAIILVGALIAWWRERRKDQYDRAPRICIFGSWKMCLALKQRPIPRRPIRGDVAALETADAPTSARINRRCEMRGGSFAP